MALKRARRERIKGITTPASLSDLDAQMEVKRQKDALMQSLEVRVPRHRAERRVAEVSGGQNGDDAASSPSCDRKPGLIPALRCLLREAQRERLPSPVPN